MKILRPLLLSALLASALTGCASFNGQMVDANGNAKDCSTSGGGLGLGAVIGASVAYASNKSCESDMAAKGYLLKKNIGLSGIDLDHQVEDKAIVVAAKPPAAACINPGDVLVKIDDVAQPDKITAKKALFGKAGKSVEVAYLRDNTTGNCRFTLVN